MSGRVHGGRSVGGTGHDRTLSSAHPVLVTATRSGPGRTAAWATPRSPRRVIVAVCRTPCRSMCTRWCPICATRSGPTTSWSTRPRCACTATTPRRSAATRHLWCASPPGPMAWSGWCGRFVATASRSWRAGSGTGLAGGAVPLDGAVVISTTRMDRVLSVDVDARVAWVQPGVLNLDLTRSLRPHGLHFAPDPSSQQACTIGGNVANNSGGPHCLAYGVTSAPRPGGGGGARRRRRRRAGWRGGRNPGLRPAGRVRRWRGHAGHRHGRRRATHP